MRTLVVIAIVAVVAATNRKRLVHLLTRTTGTWVGTPETGPR